MYKFTIVALAFITMAINTTAQTLFTATARMYLPTATTFTQWQIDSFNNAVNYQQDIVNGQCLTFPDLTPISLTWNGTTWVAPTPVAITNAFTTPLMVGSISHTTTTTAGALAPNVVVDWADVVGTTQYRFRIRPLGGSWNVSTITGSQRTLTTLAYSTTYEVQVRVYISASVQGEYTQSYYFTTPTFVPLPTCNTPIVTANATSDSITLSWASVAQATAYQVQIRELGSLVWGGTTINATTYKFASTGKAYEYQVRTACTGANSAWSTFSITDTATSAICTPPSAYTATGKTFTWSAHQYGNYHQVQIRKVGTTNWGGTATASNSVTFSTLQSGTYEWRVRSKCYATTNTGWTAFSPIQYHTIVSLMMFETIKETPKPEGIYDLTGRKLNVSREELPAGIYIINGEKVGIVK